MDNFTIIIIVTLFVLIYLNINLDTCEHFTKKHKLCIMAIFRNEHTYMEEWLNHHIEQGIDHFYLYCNDPDLNRYAFLHGYNNKITLIPWTDKVNDGARTIQRQAYTHCIRNYCGDCQFLMILDLDEFLSPLSKDKKVKDIVNGFDPQKIKAIKIMRFDYGSNGHLARPPGPIISNYDKHEKTCSSYKAMANSDFVDRFAFFYGVHDFPYNNKHGKVLNSYFSYSKKGVPMGCEEDTSTEVPLIIKHYYMKSRDEYIHRCDMWKRGGVNFYGYRKNCIKNFEEKDSVRNDISGYSYLSETG